jgi:hypothetical protein
LNIATNFWGFHIIPGSNEVSAQAGTAHHSVGEAGRVDPVLAQVVRGAVHRTLTISTAQAGRNTTQETGVLLILLTHAHDTHV